MEFKYYVNNKPVSAREYLEIFSDITLEAGQTKLDAWHTIQEAKLAAVESGVGQYTFEADDGTLFEINFWA